MTSLWLFADNRCHCPVPYHWSFWLDHFGWPILRVSSKNQLLALMIFLHSCLGFNWFLPFIFLSLFVLGLIYFIHSFIIEICIEVLYYFQVYDIVIWYLHTSWDDDHDKSGNYLSPYIYYNITDLSSLNHVLHPCGFFILSLEVCKSQSSSVLLPCPHNPLFWQTSFCSLYLRACLYFLLSAFCFVCRFHLWDYMVFVFWGLI